MFEIIKKISSGAFGTVYEGKNKQNDSKVAIKQLFINKKVQREMYLHSKLNHPNVVKLFQTKIEDQSCYMYMEYCEYDLHQFIQGIMYPLKANIIKSIAYQILQGLNYIHHQQIVHRDLKPSNIMISDGVVKIGDFGSAEHLSKLEGGGQYSNEGFSKWYMSPEQLFGSRTYGTEIDIWAFGCIYAELLQGLPLFTGKGEIDQIIQIGNVLGSPTEKNWPKIKQMPDFGKINFKITEPQDLQDYFDLSDKEQIEFLKSVLLYQDRPTAELLLQSQYFHNVEDLKTIIPQFTPQKEQINPNFKY